MFSFRNRKRIAREQNRRKTRRALFTGVEQLETRRAFIVSPGPSLAPVVPRGGAFDGVVNLNDDCSASLLASGRHILTAAHCVDSDGTSGTFGADGDQTVTFELARGGLDVDISIPVQAASISVFPTWDSTASSGGDISILTLADAAGKQIIAPFGAQRYDIFSGNALGQQFTLVGYGIDGVGQTGSVAGTYGTKRSGINRFDATRDGSNGPGTQDILRYDFDNGLAAQNSFGDLGLPDSLQAGGDSGGPAMINVNGNWQIAGVVSYRNTGIATDISGNDSTFGEIGHYTNATSYLTSFINPTTSGAFHAVLDMNFQVLGRTIPGEDLRIVARRIGSEIVVNVVNLTNPGIYEGEYFRAPASDVLSLTLIGSTSDFFDNPDGGDNETFVIANNLGVPISIDGGELIDAVDTSALAAQSFEISGTGGTDGFAVTSSSAFTLADNIESIIGSTAFGDTLIGMNAPSTWQITNNFTGASTYTSTNSLAFSNIENLNGGNSEDEFVFGGKTINGSIKGGLGDDTLDFSNIQSQKVELSPFGILGTNDGFQGQTPGSNPIGGTFDDINEIIGSSNGAADELVGLNKSTDWQLIAGIGKYTDTGSGRELKFSKFDILTGGSAEDHFVIDTDYPFSLTVNGKDPTPPNAGKDILEVIFGAAISPTLNVTKPGQDGVFTFANGIPPNLIYTGIEQLDVFDYSDAPDTFGTLKPNGARHRLGGGLFLGASVDPESDGIPGATALGDDQTGAPDDENGVTLPTTLIAQFKAAVIVNANGPGFLDAWIDYNGNGVFSANERIATSLPVVAGNTKINFVVPEFAMAGTSYARFRISNTAGLGATGLAEEGEVEDYAVTIATLAPGTAKLFDDPTTPGSIGKVVAVGGTNANDDIFIEQIHPSATVRVRFSNKTIASFENAGVVRVLGTARAGHDKLVLDDEFIIAAEFYGGSGDDIIYGSRNNDCIDGGDGNDRLHAQWGDDMVVGGTGDDLMYGFYGNDTMDGGAGHDRIYGEQGNDYLTGFTGDDWIYGGDGQDTLLGNNGSDKLFGDGSADVLIGEAGDDELHTGAGRDIAIGSSGIDRLFSDSGEDILIAGTTAYDPSLSSLYKILRELNSATAYATRINNIQTGGGAILGGIKLKKGAGATVFDDVSIDEVYASADLLWAFVGPTDKKIGFKAKDKVN